MYVERDQNVLLNGSPCEIRVLAVHKSALDHILCANKEIIFRSEFLIQNSIILVLGFFRKI